MSKLDIIVIGASGDLARKKIFPALFDLYTRKRLPGEFRIYGFARSVMSDDEFRARIGENLTCKYVPGHNCAEEQAEFVKRCSYVRGDYDSSDSFLDLFAAMHANDPAAGSGNRLFFLAVPPAVFLDIANALGGAGLVHCGSDDPWTRVVVEKPFGRDRASSDMLVDELSMVFAEHHTYRIDHYLGKEAIQNLMVLRFGNTVLEPIWCSRYIESVHIDWSEDFGCEGRGGYFDEYGIIRDVMQNHLVQILALTAMERPSGNDATAVRDAKVALLRCVKPASTADTVLGQYSGSADGKRRGYREDPSVPDDSITPTYASTRLEIENDRWRGVPFYMTAGKALGRKVSQLRVVFKALPGNIFCSTGSCPEANELVVRIQPNEGIFLRLNSKVPGVDFRVEPRYLDMQYHEAFSEIIPDAYERLLLDVIEGERGLFIRSDELEAAWDIFTPLLHEIDRMKVKPVSYAYGSGGPVNETA